MKHPQFFDTIETITLRDDLCAFLGTLEGGVVTFSYLDIIGTPYAHCFFIRCRTNTCAWKHKVLYGNAFFIEC